MPDYKYKTSIVIGHRPDGRPIRKYIQDNSKMRFDAKVRQVRALTERGGAPGKTTVEEWAWQWFRSYKAPRVGASQRINYETHIRLRITPTLGALPIADVKPFQVQQLLNEARTDDGKPLGAGTAAQLRYIVRAIFEQAEINGLIVASPCRNLEMPVTRKKERRSLTHEEEDIIRKVAESHYAGPWVLLMLDCGLRRGESVPIGWQDIKDGLLQISHSVEYKSDCNQPTLKDTKTAAGVRFVPLPDELAAMLDKCRATSSTGRTAECLPRPACGGCGRASTAPVIAPPVPRSTETRSSRTPLIRPSRRTIFATPTAPISAARAWT